MQSFPLNWVLPASVFVCRKTPQLFMCTSKCVCAAKHNTGCHYITQVDTQMAPLGTGSHCEVDGSRHVCTLSTWSGLIWHTRALGTCIWQIGNLVIETFEGDRASLRAELSSLAEAVSTLTQVFFSKHSFFLCVLASRPHAVNGNRQTNGQTPGRLKIFRHSVDMWTEEKLSFSLCQQSVRCYLFCPLGTRGVVLTLLLICLHMNVQLLFHYSEKNGGVSIH